MIVQVKVAPGNAPIEENDQGLLVHTSARRENNRANLDVIKQIAKYYNVETSSVSLIKGRTSRNKTFKVDL